METKDKEQLPPIPELTKISPSFYIKSTTPKPTLIIKNYELLSNNNLEIKQ
jgi:hypothetical protein